jgi:hemoglobin
MENNDITTREDIELLVDQFYAKVLNDPLIGYIFKEVAKIDLKNHMPTMYDFWESTLFHKTLYKGNPMKVHLDLHEKERLEKAHFDKWVALFNQTVDELFQGEKAELAKTRALSIATVMQIKIHQELR